MNTIQIVTNPDRVHVSVNGRPVVTYLFSDYDNEREANRAEHAIHDAKAQVFNVIAEYHKAGSKIVINTDIEAK